MQRRMQNGMLVWGTANPQGVADQFAVFLSDADVSRAARDIVGKPVRIEHGGGDVGRVVSAWKAGGKLDVLFEIDRSRADGSMIAQLVNDGACRELSLGYSSTCFNHSTLPDMYMDKSVEEVSLVRKGDRHDCHIHAFSTQR